MSEAVHTVLAVREFQSKPVADNVVLRIINPMDSNAKRGEYRLRYPSNANLTAVQIEITMALVEGGTLRGSTARYGELRQRALQEEDAMKYPMMIVATVGLVLLVLACSEAPSVSPDLQGTLNITLDDFKFTPDRIDLLAGRKVRMILENKSAKHAHGFAIGYNLTREGVYPNGFENDLFEGVDVTVTGPAKLINPGDAILTREGDAGSENGIGGNSNNGHGFMVLIEPSSEPTIIEFIVPKKFGEWEFTSFENDGEHYEEGMRGIVRVFAMEDNRKPWNKMPQDKDQPPTPTPK